MRNWLNKHPVIVAAGSVVLIAVLILVVSRRGRAIADQSRYVFFYDLGSNKLIAVESSQQPPLTGPSGSQAVRAVVYGCGGCASNQRFIAWLETLTDKAKAAMTMPPNHSSDELTMRRQIRMVEAGRLVALEPKNGEKPQWIPATSPQGQQLQQDSRKQCDKQVKYCYPLPSEYVRLSK